MIITLTGAYKNVGDHLIGDRGRKLIAKYIDKDITNIDRKHLNDDFYKVAKKAKKIFLCGGPAYQKNIFPNVYDLDLSRIGVPVVPFGLGYKDTLESKEFRFTPSALDFVKKIHLKIENSSARDVKTVKALNENDIQNVIMTGCPAWYDLATFDQPFQSVGTIKQIVVSVPAKVDAEFGLVLKHLHERYPAAKKFLAFHHGVFVGLKPREARLSLYNLRAISQSLLGKYKTINLKGDLPLMEKIYKSCDLHVGYRVHAHLFCLSQRKPSLLISEDQRGISQTMTLNGRILQAHTDTLFDDLSDALDDVANKGESTQQSIQVMREKFEVMKKFLESNC